MNRMPQENSADRSGHPSPTVSVVVPALNEERNLPYVLARLPERLREVILVDGGSVDRTVEVARANYPSIIVVQQTRTGKGNALACGFAACTGDIIVMIDADGSTDPMEIPRFVQALTDGADIAKGSRFSVGGGSEDITQLRRLGNRGLNGLVNLLFGTRFTDLCYGYNAFWRHVLPRLELPDVAVPAPAGGGKLWGDGFEIESLINIRSARHGLRIREVASLESRRLYGGSNLNAVTDGMRVLRTIITEFWRPVVRTPNPVEQRPVEQRAAQRRILERRIPRQRLPEQRVNEPRVNEPRVSDQQASEPIARRFPINGGRRPGARRLTGVLRSFQAARWMDR